MTRQNLVLLSDVGGTNIRFALYEQGAYTHFEKFKGENFASYEEAIAQYLKNKSVRPTMMVIGAAGKISNGHVSVTNSYRGLEIDAASLRKHLKLDKCILVNDLVPYGVSVPRLPQKNLEDLAVGHGTKKGTTLIVWPGTGLGLCYIQDGKVCASESGHMKIQLPLPIVNETDDDLTDAQAGQLDKDMDLMKFLARKSMEKATRRQGKGFVSAEDVVSGRGIKNVYDTLTAPRMNRTDLTPREISELVLKNDTAAIRAHETFFRFFGAFVGNLATSLKAGRIIIGGDLLRVLPMKIQESDFIPHFLNCGRMTDDAMEMSVQLVTQDYPFAMEGLRLIADDVLKNGKNTLVNPNDFFISSLPEKQLTLEQKRKVYRARRSALNKGFEAEL